MRFMKACWVASSVLFFASVPAFASGTEQLARFLSGVQSASGVFSQSTVSRHAGQAEKSFSGSFMFKRPGKFVWTYEKPYQQAVYCNGKTVSVWDPDLRQVTVKRMASAMPSSPASILFGNNDFRKDFQVKDLPDANGAEWLEAVPRAKETAFTSIKLGFRDGMPVVMELKDNFGQTMHFTFSDLKKNPAIAASKFEFIPPKGAEVLAQ